MLNFGLSAQRENKARKEILIIPSESEKQNNTQ